MNGQVTIYGADWCGDTRRALQHLDSKGVEYDYINIDDDTEGEKKVIAFSNGKRRIPLVEVASDDGTKSMAVPSASELDAALGG
jgi:mycoredoxin